MKQTLHLALLQHDCQAEAAVNLQTIEDGIRKAAAEGAELVLLQELHNTVYFCQQQRADFFRYAEPIPGPSSRTLGRLARELGIVIVASLFERRAAGVYHNTAIVLEKDGQIAGRYRKMHIPEDPGFEEKYYFTPGDLGFRPIQTSVGRLGILVCWDQWFPEAARLMAMAGAELLLYPTAIGWDPRDPADEQRRQLDAWLTIQRSHAIANGLPLASCNRSGHETGPDGTAIEFWGHSFVCGPQGEYLVRDTTADACLLHVAIDRQRSERVRQIWPYFRDRRIDAYGGLSQRWLDKETTNRPESESDGQKHNKR